MRRLASLSAIAISLLVMSCLENNFDIPITPDSNIENNFIWPRSTAETEGFDTSKFNASLKYIQDSVKSIRSMVIIRNGKLVCENYYQLQKPDSTYNLHSTTKSIVNVLAGIALQDSLINGGINATVLDYFPELKIETAPDIKKNITVEHLLTMMAGIRWDDAVDDFYNSTEAVKFILDKPMDTLPGIDWNYNSGLTHVLSHIPF
jgi:CubicO group peptidase (beta-lactamase class C family)